MEKMHLETEQDKQEEEWFDDVLQIRMERTHCLAPLISLQDYRQRLLVLREQLNQLNSNTFENRARSELVRYEIRETEQEFYYIKVIII